VSTLAADLRWGLDATCFVGEALDVTPDPWQRTVLTSTSDRMLLNCCRQSGKSTTTAQLALWKALYLPGSTTLLLSPSMRQSSELFRKITGLLRRLEQYPRKLEDNRLSLELETHSRIVSLPASEPTVRGFTADTLIEDEAARVPDALYRAVRPMLATTKGQLILMSTPWGKRGHFYEEWTEGGDTWQRILIPATQCPRISAQFLAEERRAMGDLWFRSEYLCEFTETVDSVFHYEDVIAMMSDEVAPLFASDEDEGSEDDIAPLFSEGWEHQWPSTLG
jgi:hypothetical protein